MEIYSIRTILRSAGTSNSRESNNLLADDVNGQFCFLGGTHVRDVRTRVHRDCCPRMLHLAHGNVETAQRARELVAWNESTRRVSLTTPDSSSR